MPYAWLGVYECHNKIIVLQKTCEIILLLPYVWLGLYGCRNKYWYQLFRLLLCYHPFCLNKFSLPPEGIRRLLITTCPLIFTAPVIHEGWLQPLVLIAFFIYSSSPSVCLSYIITRMTPFSFGWFNLCIPRQNVHSLSRPSNDSCLPIFLPVLLFLILLLTPTQLNCISSLGNLLSLLVLPQWSARLSCRPPGICSSK